MLNLIKKRLLLQLVGYFSILSIVTVLLVAISANVRSRDALKRSVIDRLGVATSLKEYQVNQWVDNQRRDVIFMTQLQDIINNSEIAFTRDKESPEFKSAIESIRKFMADVSAVKPNIRQISILNNNGIVIVSTNKEKEGKYQSLGNTTTYLTRDQSRIAIPNFYISPITGKAAMTFAAILANKSGAANGVVAIDLDLQGVDDIIRERTGLGNSGETYLVGRLPSKNILISGTGANSKEVEKGIKSDSIAAAVNSEFSGALAEFLELAKKAINPKIEMADVREMIIQHVLTEDIFMRVFDEAEFHRENVIAHKLAEVAGTFYKGETKRNIHAKIAPYYETINARASQISDHHEKQKFLKALYESFYKAYNPKAADRLGIVYTPDEIVRFMIESADHLVYKHFGKTLGDKGVEILDPATGTGTFITELIEYLPPAQLEYKYDHELHCNEVSILPYYIANLNIEYTYKQKTGKFNEFENICFVDTLDNMGFEHTGKQLNFFGLTDANSERIVKQNSKPIMLVIGNPPYSANQANENENNKNREYPEIDQRIKDTYIYYSTAQKSKVYDMYARFYRWASDRLDKNGIIAFITNSSFLDSKTFDGFRKIVSDEFSHIYIVDLGGNVRKNPKLSGTTNNVFGIQTGVAIAFFVKTDKKGKTPAQIFYTRRPEMELATEKLDYLRSTKISEIKFENIRPDKQNNWLNLTENNWDDLIPVATKEGKAEKGIKEPKTIFKNFSLGVATNRDEWVYDESPENLEKKIKYFFGLFENEKNRWAQSDKKKAINDFVDRSIKWTSELEAHLKRGTKLEFNKNKITSAMYRPFVKRPFYYDTVIVHRPYQQTHFFQIGEKPDNLAICMNMNGKDFNVLSVNSVPDLHFNGDLQCLPLYRYSEFGRARGECHRLGVGAIQEKI